MEWELYEEHFNVESSKKIEWVMSEISKIRIGRISPKVLDLIKVEAYGDLVSLSEIANISSPDAWHLLIKPYDKTMIKSISTALNKTSLGVNPQVDADLIRLSFPAPTEQSRKDATKKVKNIIEQGKIFIRDVRKEVQNSFKKDDELSEDNLHWYKEKIDLLTKKNTILLEEIQAKKNKDIMTI